LAAVLHVQKARPVAGAGVGSLELGEVDNVPTDVDRAFFGDASVVINGPLLTLAQPSSDGDGTSRGHLLQELRVVEELRAILGPREVLFDMSEPHTGRLSSSGPKSPC
jgi:hypothetical protein